MKLGSEGVYLHEKCGTNPSRHLPGPKTPVKNIKRPIWGSRGFRAEILYIYIYIYIYYVSLSLSLYIYI